MTSTSSASSASSTSPSGSVSGSEYTQIMHKIKHHNKEHFCHPLDLYKDKEWKEAMWKVPNDKMIEYVDAKKLSGSDWRNDYERKQKVCIIRNLTDDWKANKKWGSEKNLRKNYGSQKFAVGGKKLSLDHYLRYCKDNKDDSPVYLFESQLHQHGLNKMLDDYEVPEYFKDDYFDIVGSKLRPPFRWFVVGPERSGTMIHQDPLWTSAWNTLLAGHKKWVIWPPKVKKETFFPKKHVSDLTDHIHCEASHWFKQVYPHLDHENRIECIQKPGETIFVPGGWWHCVLNLDFTVAVTQNFVSKANFDNVYKLSKAERGRFAKRWKKLLNFKEPKLAKRADKLQAKTGTVSSVDSGWTEIDDLPTLSKSDYGKRLPIHDPKRVNTFSSQAEPSSGAGESAVSMARRRRKHYHDYDSYRSEDDYHFPWGPQPYYGGRRHKKHKSSKKKRRGGKKRRATTTTTTTTSSSSSSSS